MQLEIFLNSGVNKEAFVKHVKVCIGRGYDQDRSEIKTWRIEKIESYLGVEEDGIFHHNTQYEKNGWVRIRPSITCVIGEFLYSKNFLPTPEEEAIILFRFASMLQRHFNSYIRTISLTGI